MKNATVAKAKARSGRSKPETPKSGLVWYGERYEEERRELLKKWFETANVVTNYYSNAELRDIISDTLLDVSKQHRELQQGYNVFADQLPNLSILRRGLSTPTRNLQPHAD